MYTREHKFLRLRIFSKFSQCSPINNANTIKFEQNNICCLNNTQNRFDCTICSLWALEIIKIYSELQEIRRQRTSWLIKIFIQFYGSLAIKIYLSSEILQWTVYANLIWLSFIVRRTHCIKKKIRQKTKFTLKIWRSHKLHRWW